jgi:hypothetical protein
MTHSEFPLAARLFERLTIIYGSQKIKAMYDHDDNAIMPAMEAWNMMLKSQKPEVVRKVLDALVRTAREWPPNLSEFTGMCRDFDRVEHRTYDALPAPKVQTDVGRSALANMKAMLESKRMKAQ